MPNGLLLEVVEPAPAYAQLFTGPVPAMTVPMLQPFTQRLTEQGVQFLTEIIEGPAGWGWCYLQIPGAGLLCLHGPL